MASILIPGLRKFMVSECIVGEGAIALAGRSARNLAARHVLVVSDPGVVATGLVDKVLTQLREEGIASTLFSAVSPNPRDHEVAAGVKLGQTCDCNLIIAVGGGSPMDCAKGIAVVLANGGDVRDYEGVDRIVRPGPPMICIPTTAGTAADISQFAIVTDTSRAVKIALISKMLVPDLALIDPGCTCTMDAQLTACTGIDALTHAMEALVSTAHWSFTDLCACDAIRLVNHHLAQAVNDGANMEARAGMTLASTQAGYAFSNVSLGAVHAMAHALGGLLDLPHGMCNALLLEHVVRFNHASAPETYARAAEALGLDLRGLTEPERRERLCAALRHLRMDCGLVGGLEERGMHRSHLPALAAIAHRDPCLATNPRIASAADLEAIYAEAL
jgi:alcohol dehydrogenase class IV